MDVLAAGSPAEAAGRLTVTIGIPLLGLILLIVGLNQRSKSRSTPPFQGSPYPYPAPSAPPQQPHYQQGYPPPYQGGYPPGYVPVPPQKPRGTALIVTGARADHFRRARLPRKLRDIKRLRKQTGADYPLRVGQCITEADYTSQKLPPATASHGPASAPGTGSQGRRIDGLPRRQERRFRLSRAPQFHDNPVFRVEPDTG